MRNRPEVALATQQEQFAAATVDGARTAFSSAVAARGGRGSTAADGFAIVELDRRRDRPDQCVPWLADEARLAETRAQAARHRSRRARAETLARLDVRIAIAELEAARASEAVGQRRRTRRERPSHHPRPLRDRSGGCRHAAARADAVQQADARDRRARGRAHGNNVTSASDRKAMTTSFTTHYVAIAGVTAALSISAVARRMYSSTGRCRSSGHGIPDRGGHRRDLDDRRRRSR